MRPSAPQKLQTPQDSLALGMVRASKALATATSCEVHTRDDLPPSHAGVAGAQCILSQVEAPLRGESEGSPLRNRLEKKAKRTSQSDSDGAGREAFYAPCATLTPSSPLQWGLGAEPRLQRSLNLNRPVTPTAAQPQSLTPSSPLQWGPGYPRL